VIQDHLDHLDALQQTLMAGMEGMFHDVQRELRASGVGRGALDGLCFRGDQLASCLPMKN